MKKRYSNRHKVNFPDSDLVYIIKSVNEEKFCGDICYYNFRNSNIKISTPNGRTIIDNNYRLLEFFDYNSNIKLTTFYDNNLETLEWYFDMAKEIGKENEIPYHEDLFLDVVVNSDGKILLLDEDELKEALEAGEITKEEYDLSYKEANNLLSILNSNGKVEALKQFTDKYLNYFENTSNSL